MKYPLGIQSFQKIREGGYAYVDKTALVYQLAESGQYYFLSRPRRFGKSLLISTLEAYFLGKRELFQGLAIEQLETKWQQHPVLHFDLNAEKYTTPEALATIIGGHLNRWEDIYGKDEREASLSERFKGIIRRASESTGQKVAILVDEYDKPILQTIGKPELQEDYRTTLKAVLGVMKSMDAHIQFGLITGVTKFSKVSVFSDLNNLTDITLNRHYSTICGISEKEIHDTFDSQVDEMAKENGISKDKCYHQLKENYDGYHFSEDTVGIYNPYSLLNALSEQRFRDYWFETGTPTYIVEVMKQSAFDIDRMTSEEVTSDLLGSLDTIDSNPLPLIYQSGYLTLKSYDSRFGTYMLGYPNFEVERGFTSFLLPYYSPIKREQVPSFINSFVKEVETGDVEKFMRRLEAFFAQGDYQLMGDAELYFHNAVSLIFRMVGIYTEVERHTSDGRMDMVVKTCEYVYIFEFKLDQTADAALQQIERKQYAKPFEGDGRTIFKIGVNFSSQTRRIEGWKIG